MCWINNGLTVANIFVIIILYLACGTIGNRLVTVCEKASVNISCENGTIILIQDVQFGPLAIDNEIDEEYMKDRQPTLNVTNFERLCDNRSHCYLDELEMFELDTYPYISRLVNITYHCDFEYFGCYEDDEKRLFTGGSSEEYVKANMSALICYNFCSVQDGSRPYFGTEAGYACFCGYENEIKKLNRTEFPNYNWHDTKDCNANCRQHEYEKCGRHGLISIYTTKTIHKHNRIKVAEYTKPKCMFNSSFNITTIRYLRAKHCERKELENRYDCDKNNCWVEAPLSFVIGSLENSLQKYVTINYTCITPLNNGNKVSAAEREKQEYTGIVIGIVSGLILICGVIVGICFFKRNRSNGNKGPEIGTKNRTNKDIVEYENIQSTDKLYSTATGTISGNRYSVETKQKGTCLKLEQDNTTFTSPDDVYVDTAEGVYDISNNHRCKVSNENQAIYSHTTEGIYNSTTINDHIPNDEENTYDQGFHQPEQNVYGISST